MQFREESTVERFNDIRCQNFVGRVRIRVNRRRAGQRTVWGLNTLKLAPRRDATRIRGRSAYRAWTHTRGEREKMLTLSSVIS